MRKKIESAKILNSQNEREQKSCKIIMQRSSFDGFLLKQIVTLFSFRLLWKVMQ